MKKYRRKFMEEHSSLKMRLFTCVLGVSLLREQKLWHTDMWHYYCSHFEYTDQLWQSAPLTPTRHGCTPARARVSAGPSVAAFQSGRDSYCKKRGEYGFPSAYFTCHVIESCEMRSRHRNWHPRALCQFRYHAVRMLSLQSSFISRPLHWRRSGGKLGL